ncbi:MAG: hypothetical protein A2Z20_12365 [Bdellovibrionales bacterium RBG_16_40_8]|nr:MAG: hypothetical protein A2Z20_12365 [Bdellovibrionales bacterium RBG_16_40_8]
MRRIWVCLFFITFLISSFGISANIITPERPDVYATPGDLCDETDPDFIEYRYQEHVAYCERNVSVNLKAKIYKYYNIPANRRRSYTIDHYIPLSIGGSNHEQNLWPEHKEIKKLRPNLEVEVYEAVREGRITRQQAIDEIIKAKMNPPLLF